MKKSSLIATLCAFIVTLSCTKTNYDLGSEMIPGSEILGFGFDTLTSIDSYTRTMDSMNTSQWGLVYCGSSISSFSGKSTFSFISTVLPYSGFSADSIWGTDPTPDSVDFVLSISDVTGNSSFVQRFNIYELDKDLGIMNDSVMTYYSNFDYQSYINPTPIATIDVTGEDTTYLARLPLEYATPYIDTTGGYYLDDSTFFTKFKGFYIESENSQFSDVCREIDLEASGLYIYYHNKNEDPDTLTGFFSMINSSSSIANVAFNIIEHDFSFADPIYGINQSILDDTTTLYTESYIVAQGGLSMQLKFDSTQFHSIIEKYESEGYSKIAVSNATLIVPIENNSLYAMDNAVGKLGCYFDFPTAVTVVDYGNDVINESSGLPHPFGGYLNRALYEYKLDITSYVQTLFNGDESQFSIELAPAYGFDSLPQGVTIKREDVKLALTYFLIN